MAVRRSVLCLDRCAKVREGIVRDIKSHPSAPLSSTTNAFHDIFRPTAFWGPPSKQLLAWRATLTPASRRSFASQAENDIKKTPLYDLHVSKKAKFVPFGGYSMPLYYDDLSHVESHHWTREKASIFDVSHMYAAASLPQTTVNIVDRVQHKLSGPSAEAFLMQITPTAVNSLDKYQSTLTCLLEGPSGGIVDDTVITRVGNQAFYFVTNAACRDNDLAFIQAEMTKFRETHEVTDENDLDWMILERHSLLALQGPRAASALQTLVFVDEEDPEVSTDLSTLHFGNARYLQLNLPDGTNTPSLLISRTGYTGEDGFEISIPPESGDSTELTTKIAEALLADPSTVRLAGLAARDSLRLEAGMCLYGHDIDLSTTPPEAGLGWTVSKERRSGSTANFNGSSKILEELASPKSMQQRRVGLTAEKGAPAREGAEIVDMESGDVIGKVTSGLPSPSLGGANIAMGLVKNGWHKKGTKVGIKVRKNVRQAEVVKMPFVENKFHRG